MIFGSFNFLHLESLLPVFKNIKENNISIEKNVSPTVVWAFYLLGSKTEFLNLTFYEIRKWERGRNLFQMKIKDDFTVTCEFWSLLIFFDLFVLTSESCFFNHFLAPSKDFLSIFSTILTVFPIFNFLALYACVTV